MNKFFDWLKTNFGNRDAGAVVHYNSVQAGEHLAEIAKVWMNPAQSILTQGIQAPTINIPTKEQTMNYVTLALDFAPTLFKAMAVFESIFPNSHGAVKLQAVTTTVKSAAEAAGHDVDTVNGIWGELSKVVDTLLPTLAPKVDAVTAVVNQATTVVDQVATTIGQP